MIEPGAPSAAPALAAPTVFEDADVLVVDKPAGVVVVPARDEPAAQSLHKQLEALRGERLWVVHRLDRETSGVLLFARNADAHRVLSMAFERHEARKTYVALTSPLPAKRERTVRTPLHTARKGKMRPALPEEPGSLPCETFYRIDDAFAAPSGAHVASLTVRPATGRQHQIRVHLRSIDAPLLVDATYARVPRLAADALGPGSPALERLSLHALALEVPSPRGAGVLAFEAPIAADLAAVLAYLRHAGSPLALPA